MVLVLHFKRNYIFYRRQIKVRIALHSSFLLYSIRTIGKVVINCSFSYVFLEIWRIIWLAQLSQGLSMDFQSWNACKY